MVLSLGTALTESVKKGVFVRVRVDALHFERMVGAEVFCLTRYKIARE